MASDPNQWSKLPNDVLLLIYERLKKDSIITTNILRLLRAVCSPWRSSLPFTPPDPIISAKFPFPISHNHYLNPQRSGHFTLSQRSIYYLEPYIFPKPYSSSSDGWIVCVVESKSGEMQIFDPLSNIKYPNLSQISSKVINLLDLRVSEVCQVCSLEFVGDLDDLDFNEMKSIRVNKVAASDNAVLTIHTGGKLGYLKLGDEKWTVIDDGQVRSHYDSILYREDKFYALSFTGRVIVIDSSKIVNAIESPIPCYGRRYGGNHKYLVESLGELYMLDKYSDLDQGEEYFDENDFEESDSDEDGEDKEGDTDCNIKFLVYKLNDNEKEWVQVSSLGDRVFFIGDEYCFSVSARQFPGCKNNCIYFTDLDFMDDEESPGHGIGMFDLENDSVGPLSSFKRCSRIFWPPPTWLNLKTSSNPSASR